MAVYRPIKEERRSSNPGATKATYTSRPTTRCYIDSPARLRLIRYLQSALF